MSEQHDSGARRAGWELLSEVVDARRAGIAVGVAVGLVWTLAKVSVPRIVQVAIDRGVTPGDSSELTRWSLVLGGVGVVSAAFTGWRRWFAFRESRGAEADLRSRLFAHLQRLSFAFHDRHQVGQLLSRANSDLQQIQHFVVLIPLTTSNVLTVVLVTVILLTIHAPLTALALGALPLLNLIARRFSHRLHPEVLAIQEELAQLGTVVEESVSGARAVKGFGAEEARLTALEREADDIYRVSMRAARVRAVHQPLLDVLPMVGLVLVLWYGGDQVLAGNLTIGELVAFNAYVLLLVWPLRMTGMIVALAQRAAAAAGRVAEVLSEESDVADPLRPSALPARREGQPRGRVRFEHVSFRYDSGHAVFTDLDLDVPAGSSLAVVGATGSGKSTLAGLVPRYYDVTGGRVALDGVDVLDLLLADLRREVALVFEDTFLFSDTVAANIAFGRPDATDDEIERAARLAGAAAFVDALPDGYDQLVGERGFGLSGGQRQRLAIARAVLTDPRVLILDDATSAVDPGKEHEIRDAIGEVMESRTTIVIAHRPATVALAQRVVLLSDGRVAAEGTHDELIKAHAGYRQVLAAAGAPGAGAGR